MAKRERNYVTEIEELKTSLMGYDREAVIAYIKTLVEKFDEEKEAAVKEMAENNLTLAAENAAMKSEIQTRKQVYEELVKRVDQLGLAMDTSMNKIGSYADESAKTLEDYRRREQELSLKEQQAEQKRETILSTAKEEAERIKAAAEAEIKQMLAEAESRRADLLQKAQAESDAILAKGRRGVQKQQELYGMYWNHLREFSENLQGIVEKTEFKMRETALTEDNDYTRSQTITGSETETE